MKGFGVFQHRGGEIRRWAPGVTCPYAIVGDTILLQGGSVVTLMNAHMLNAYLGGLYDRAAQLRIKFQTHE